MEVFDKLTSYITKILSKAPKSKKDLIIEGGKLGKDLVKNISKKFNKKTNRKILTLNKKTKTKQINKRAENLKKKQSKSKALVPVKNNKLMNMNYSDFMKMPIIKQSRALTVTNKTNTGTGTSIVPKQNRNIVKKQNRNIVDSKPKTNIVKKNQSTALTTTQKPNISTKGLNRKSILTGLNQIKKDGVKLGQEVLGDDIPKKEKKKQDITPKVMKPKTGKVITKELPKLTEVKKKKRSNITQRGKPTSSYDAQYTYDMLKKKGGKDFAKARMSKENFAKVKKYSAGTQGKTIAGLKDLPSKSENPGIHMLPAKAKMNMGFKPMFGGGLVASFYDKPEKVEKYKGNTSVARQVKGYGKAKKKT